MDVFQLQGMTSSVMVSRSLLDWTLLINVGWLFLGRTRKQGFVPPTLSQKEIYNEVMLLSTPRKTGFTHDWTHWEEELQT